MCLNCGCGLPTISHGDKRNITLDDLQQASTAQNMPLGQTVFNIIKTMPKVVAQMPEGADKTAVILTMSLMVSNDSLTPDGSPLPDELTSAENSFQSTPIDVQENNPQEPANILGPLYPNTDTSTDVTNVKDNPMIQ